MVINFYVCHLNLLSTKADKNRKVDGKKTLLQCLSALTRNCEIDSWLVVLRELQALLEEHHFFLKHKLRLI